MSKINNLIKELCPNGVEYLELYKVVKWNKKFSGVNNDWQNEIFTTKSNISAQELKSLLFEDGNIKLLSTGNFDGYTSGTAYDGPVDDYEIITIPSGGTANIKYYNGKFINSGNILGTTIDKNKYNLKYVYYCLINKKNLIQSFFRGSSVQHPDMKQIIQITIPIPPIEVQVEMVRILDKFGELEAELEAELEVRKSQYEFWRGKLLNDGNELVKLKEICTYSNDRISYDKLNEDNYVGVDNLLQNKKGKTKSYHVPTSGNSTKFEKNDILVGNIRPYLRKIWFADCYGGTNGDVLDIRVNDTKKIYPRFLYYVLSSESFFEYNNSNSKGAKMPRGDKQAIMNYEFAVPSIEKQIHIANVLDQFDKLVNNISDGLPAEIELRRKQYEYYRNKLLSFEEL